MKIDIYSDIHIGSCHSKKDLFIKELETLSSDWLILNGDIYDLIVDNSIEVNIFQTIENNKNIKKFSYIQGNHDPGIDKLLGIEVVNEIVIGDIVITHGHHFDSNIFHDNIVKLRDWVDKLFGINIRLFLLKFPILGKYGERKLKEVQEKAKNNYPGKRVIIGHIHIPMCDKENHNYNCGAMTDSLHTKIVIQDGDISLIVI